MTFHWADGFHPKVAEAGWWPFSGCGWLFASPKECLEDGPRANRGMFAHVTTDASQSSPGKINEHHVNRL